MVRRLSLVAFVAACSGGPAGEVKIDASRPPDTAPMPDASVCVPLSQCDWLDGYQRHIVGALAGAEDIKPGVKLAHRETISERDIARQFVLDELTALGYTPTRHDYSFAGMMGANVLARLESTSGSGSLIVIGAHFDGVATGPAAADNATGVAIVLAAARYLRTVSTREHPVVFALFDQEELGLIGSQAYAATLVPADVKSVHVFDMVSFDGDGDRAVELWSPTTGLAQLYQQYGTAAGMPVSVVAFNSSDHQAFLDRGLKAVGVSEEFVGGDHTSNYHKATDTYENINFDYLERVTQLAFTALEGDVRTP
jgi:hypothetical protein